MPSILRRRLYARQRPPIGATLDTSHPLAQGLGDLWLFNEGGGSPRSLVHPAHVGTLTNGPVWSTGRRGRGVELAAGTTQYVLLGTDTSLSLPTGPITIILGYQKLDTTARGSNAFGVDASNAALACNLYLPFSDGTVYFDYGGQSEGTTRKSVAGLTVADNIWAFTVGARGMEIWQDGVLVASNGANPTRTNGGLNFILGGLASQGQASDNARVWYFGWYSQQLATAAIQQLTAELFAMLRPPLALAFFILSGAGVQIAVPVSDVSAGGWTPSTGSDLYAMMDEPVADDTDYIMSPRAPANAEGKIRLGPQTDPNSSTGHIVRYRFYKDPDGGARGDLTVTLYAANGTTVIASQVQTNVAPGVVAGSFTLSGAEADAIPSADYATGLVVGWKANAP